MTRDEFFKLAKIQPIEIDAPSVYLLELYLCDAEEKSYHRYSKSGDWRFRRYCDSCYFSSRSEAEKFLKKFANNEHYNSTFLNASIRQIPLNVGNDYDGDYSWWIYGRSGKLIDNSVCSPFFMDDDTRPDGKFFGRFAEQRRFAPGDIVEINLSLMSYNFLAVITDLPPTVEGSWNNYQDSCDRWGRNPEPQFKNDYFLNSMNDRYWVLTPNGTDIDYPTYSIQTPSFDVPEKAKLQFRKLYERWLLNIDDAISGKINHEQLRNILTA